jgi:alanyl-tRNA synthetase
LEGLLQELRRGRGGGGEEVVARETLENESGALEYVGIRLKARDHEDVRAWGDGYRGGGPRRVAVVAAELPEDRFSLFAFVSDDLIPQGVRADVLIREVAERVGGRGGGRPHMAQAGVGDPAGLDEVLAAGPGVIRSLLEKAK